MTYVFVQFPDYWSNSQTIFSLNSSRARIFLYFVAALRLQEGSHLLYVRSGQEATRGRLTFKSKRALAQPNNYQQKRKQIRAAGVLWLLRVSLYWIKTTRPRSTRDAQSLVGPFKL